jgi:hypothetical protein
MGFRRLLRFLILPVVGLLSSESGHAQGIPQAAPLSYDQKEVWFDKIVGIENSGLLNGHEYSIAFPGATSHPFFGSRELTNERVIFHSQQYMNVPMLYDIYTDVLVLRHRDSRGLFSLIELDKRHVKSFTLYGHQFRRMSNRASAEPHLADGFFDVLFDGKAMKLVAKYRKSSYANNGLRDYAEDVRYFFVLNDEWSEVRNNNSMMKLMPSDKKRIQAFIKGQRIKVNKRNHDQLIALATYGDTLERSKSK